MARPRNIELNEGTISLAGYSKEEADKLTDYILKFKVNTALEEITSNPNVTLVSSPAALGSMTDRAFGRKLNISTGKWEVVTVGYNLDTKQAKIETITESSNKGDSIVKFKMAAVAAGLID